MEMHQLEYINLSRMLFKNKITVIGLGYVGMPLAIMLSNKFKVNGYDIDSSKIKNKYNAEDNKLNNLFSKNINKSLLLNEMNIINKVNFICVSTKKKNINIDNDTNLSFKIIKDIIRKRIKYPKTYIILMSTTQVGFSQKVLNYIKNNNLDKKIEFLYMPERIFPSNVYNELIQNDKIIGNNNIKSFNLLKKIFSTFVKGEIINVNHKSAELIKIIENTYRNVNIGLANEIMRISINEKLDTKNIIKIANNHPRVNILNPGIGIGGHCIPIDPNFLIRKYKNIPLISGSIKTNKIQVDYFYDKINSFLNKKKYLKIIFLGLTYKENVGDIRNSPTISLIKKLLKTNKKKEFYVSDPWLISSPKAIKRAKFIENTYCDISQYDVVFLCVAHNEFKNYLSKKSNLFIDLSGYYNYENINNL